MPSKTDFNVSPYYDDYAESKKFHRVLYRPGYAVQARELTTQQSIIQNQIEKLSDHLFEHGAMVLPGNVSYDPHYYAVKLTSFTGTLANFDGNTLTGGTSGVKAQVVNYVATDGTDPDTLFVKYNDAGTDNDAGTGGGASTNDNAGTNDAGTNDAGNENEGANNLSLSYNFSEMSRSDIVKSLKSLKRGSQERKDAYKALNWAPDHTLD